MRTVPVVREVTQLPSQRLLLPAENFLCLSLKVAEPQIACLFWSTFLVQPENLDVSSLHSRLC